MMEMMETREQALAFIELGYKNGCKRGWIEALKSVEMDSIDPATIATCCTLVNRIPDFPLPDDTKTLIEAAPQKGSE